jgi:hypothetical protein
MTVAVCRFPGSTREYHYFCDATVKAGAKAYVETRRGKAEVEVVDIIDSSDRATAWLLGAGTPKDGERTNPF